MLKLFVRPVIQSSLMLRSNSALAYLCVSALRGWLAGLVELVFVYCTKIVGNTVGEKKPVSKTYAYSVMQSNFYRGGEGPCTVISTHLDVITLGALQGTEMRISQQMSATLSQPDCDINPKSNSRLNKVFVIYFRGDCCMWHSLSRLSGIST